jgi:ribose transport system substrate-binding protein
MSVQRLLAIVALAAALVFGVAACGGDDDDEGDGGETAATTDEGGGTAQGGEGGGGTVSIVASVPPTDHGWLGAIAKNAQAEAENWDDIEFELLEAEDADTQASQIETAINQEPDTLVVLPYDGEQLTPVAEEAMEAGIQVVNVDRLFSTPDAARATILGDNYGIGVQAGEFIANELNCEGNVVEIQGLAGISVTDDRTKGFADTIREECGNGIQIVAQQPADFLPDKGLTVMENILQAEDQIDAVYTHDDDMAEGVVAAIQNAGREDEMFLTGVGGSCTAFDAIEEGGLYRSTYLYNPTMAASAVRMARLIGLGQGFEDLTEPEVPSEIVVPPTEVTQDNVEDLRDYCFN